jgi:hypothetical protein
VVRKEMAMPEIQKTMRIEASIDQVASVIEDPTSVPKWNPPVTALAVDENLAQGLGSRVKWEAHLAGIPVAGSSAAIAWEPGREYAWRNTEQTTGFSLESSFTLEPVDDETNLTATLSYEVSKWVEPILDVAGVEQLLEQDVEKTLVNIRELARSQGSPQAT